MIQIYYKFRKNSYPTEQSHHDGTLSQIDRTKITIPQEELVKEYGVYWGIPGYFDPHITIVYELSLDEEKKEKVKNFLKILTVKDYSFKPTELVLASIGFHGNLEETL